MQEMMQMYSMGGMDMNMFGGNGESLVLNYNHPLVQYVLNHKEGDNTVKICEQLYDLAGISRGALAPERMEKFVKRSNEILMILRQRNLSAGSVLFLILALFHPPASLHCII